MSNNNILKFIVAIEDQATKGLDEIERHLNSMVDYFKSSTTNINKILGGIGGKENAQGVESFTKILSEVQASLKKDVGEVPLFKSVMEQMKRLQGYIGSSSLKEEIEKVRASINNLFTEVPKVNPGAFNTYFQELNKAYESFRGKLSGGKNINLTEGLGADVSRLGSISGGDTYKDMQAQVEAVKLALLKSMKEINEAINVTKGLLSNNGIDFGKVSEKVEKLSANIDVLATAFRNLNGVIKDEKLLNTAVGIGEAIRSVKGSVKALQEGSANMRVKEDFDETVKSIYRARAEIERLIPLQEKLQRQIDIAKSLGLDSEKIEKAQAEMLRLREILASIARSKDGLANGKSALRDDLTGLNTSQLMMAYSNEVIRAKNALATQTQKNSEALKNETQAQKENEIAKRSNSQATEALIQKENQLSNAIEKATGRGREHSQVISDLKGMALQYLSVWGAQQFLVDMANITGELELQKKSLEVILNSASAAQNMYSEIRDLSQMSPYSFEDLLKSHRQLAAFGIETKDVFGTLKSLSDIGAGLDVDVSRLILAYGHTRSYGYLSGIQNRQFETAGIDLVGALTDKYNKLAAAEKRAGRQAEFVSRKDIFSRMRERSIPFSDVQDVIMDLDKPGGKFYNMQIRQFETLGGKLRNLRNNYRIMMSELGEEHKGLLYGVVSIINELTENWNRYYHILRNVAIGYGAIKVAAMMAGRAGKAANLALTESIRKRQREAAVVNYLNGDVGMGKASGAGSSWRLLKKSKGVVASRENNNLVRNLAQDREVNNLVKQRIALTSKLTVAQRAYLLQSTGVNAAEARSIALASGWKRGLLSVRLGIIGVAQSFKAMTIAMLSNPMTWVFAVVEAFTWLVDRMGAASRTAEEFKNTIEETAQTDLDGIKQSLSTFEDEGIITRRAKDSYKSSEGTAFLTETKVSEKALEDYGVENAFEELDRALQVHSPLYKGDYFDIMKAKSQMEQVKTMFKKMDNIEYATQVYELNKEDMGNAIESSGGVFDDDVIKNMSDYNKSYEETLASINLTDENWSKVYDNDKRAIEDYMKKLGISKKEAIAKYIEDVGVESFSSLFTTRADGSTDGGVKRYKSANSLNKAFKEASDDMKLMSGDIALILKESFKGNTDAGVEFIEKTLNQMFSQAKIGNEDVKAHLSDEFYSVVIASLREMGQNKDADAYEKQQMNRKVGAILFDKIKTRVSEKSSQGDKVKAVQESLKAAIEAAKKGSKTFAAFWKKLGKKGQDAFKAGLNLSGINYANLLSNVTRWQKRAMKMGLSVTLGADVDYTEFINTIRDKIKEAREKLKANQGRINYIMGVDVNLDVRTVGDAKKLLEMFQKKRDALHNAWVRFVKKYRSKDGYIHDSQKSKEAMNLKDQWMEMDDIYIPMTEEMFTNMRGLKNEHQDLEPAKEHRSAPTHKQTGGKKGKKNGSAFGRKEDKLARDIRSQAQILGEAYSEYKKWEEKIGNTKALSKVQEEFFGKGSALTKAGFSFKDVPKYYENLNKLKDKLNKYYNSKKGHNSYVLDAIKEIGKSINQVDFDRFTKKSDNWASNMSIQLDRLTKRWERYNNVLKATGDTKMASSVALVDPYKYQDMADEIKGNIKAHLKEAGATSEYTFDKDDSDKKIDEDVKNLLGKGAKDDHIKGLVEEIKKWREAQQKAEDEGVDTFSTLMGSIDDYATRIRKANNEYESLIEKMQKAKEAGVLSSEEFEKAKQIAKDKLEWRNYKYSAPYRILITHTLTNTIASARKEGGNAKKRLDEALAHGSISADEYVQGIKDINEALDKVSKNSVSGIVRFFNESSEQKHERKANEYMDLFFKSAENYAQYRSLRASALKNGSNVRALELYGKMNEEDRNMNVNFEKAAEEKKKAKSSKAFSDGVNSAVKGLQLFSGGLNMLSRLLDGLGKSSRDVDTGKEVVGGMAQGAASFSGAGTYGMIAGAVMGGIIGLLESFRKQHEADLAEFRRQADDSRFQYDLIEKKKERTYGYFTGYQRKPDIKATQELTARELWEQFENFHKESLHTSAYDLQRKELESELETYNNMLENEKGSKYRDEARILEIDKKRAELAEQITYFAEDTAKSLWGIDLKKWADQLSDALCNAFENGENAVEAFKDATSDMLKGVVHRLMQLTVMEPMFKDLQNKLFGEKGLFGTTEDYLQDPAKAGEQAAELIASYFQTTMLPLINAEQQSWTAINRSLKEKGYDMTESGTKGEKLSSSIQGTSEETSALLAGYVNALRQDVSYMRLMQTEVFNEAWTNYVKQITGMSTTLGQIDSNVAAIRAVISENGALYSKIERLSDDFHNVILGNQNLHVI